jgi:hypothetical protein
MKVSAVALTILRKMYRSMSFMQSLSAGHRAGSAASMTG